MITLISKSDKYCASCHRENENKSEIIEVIKELKIVEQNWLYSKNNIISLSDIEHKEKH